MTTTRKHLLVTAATPFEMQPYETHCTCPDQVLQLVTGVGPMESGIRLTRLLSRSGERIWGVVNFGVGGAYLDASGRPHLDLLDLCLARQEVLGDLGVCRGDGIDPFTNESLTGPTCFTLDDRLRVEADAILRRHGMQCATGTFVTVGCASGSRQRGNILEARFHAICENMEGAAVARVCAEFSIPCLELRCISNLVEERNGARWKLDQACEIAGRTAALLVADLIASSAESLFA